MVSNSALGNSEELLSIKTGESGGPQEACSASAGAVLLLSVTGVPRDWRKEFAAEKNSLEATVSLWDTTLFVGKCHKQSFKKTERHVQNKQNNGLIEHIKTYALMKGKKANDPKDKWAEYMKWQLTEEKMQISNKDKTKYLVSQVIREMQIKAVGFFFPYYCPISSLDNFRVKVRLRQKLKG